MYRKLRGLDLPKKIKVEGANIPVMYKDELRYVVDRHYGDESLVYLKNNGGVPVEINELQVKYSWTKMLIAYKRFEEIYNLEGNRENWKKEDELRRIIHSEGRKLFNKKRWEI